MRQWSQRTTELYLAPEMLWEIGLCVKSHSSVLYIDLSSISSSPYLSGVLSIPDSVGDWLPGTYFFSYTIHKLSLPCTLLSLLTAILHLILLICGIWIATALAANLVL